MNKLNDAIGSIARQLKERYEDDAETPITLTVERAQAVFGFLRAALSATHGEPVAWRYALDASVEEPRWIYIDKWIYVDKDPHQWLPGPAMAMAVIEPLYTAPPQRECPHGVDDGACKECVNGCPPNQVCDWCQRQPSAWVGLTDVEKAEIAQQVGITEDDNAYMVSQLFKLTDDKLREKNGGGV